METISGGGGGRTTDAEDIIEGTFTLARLPTMDDEHVPDLETLSYGGTFAEAQIPDLPTVKITSGTFNADRIPILPTDRYGSAVLLTGDQTIGGTKTFGDIPILPASDPTSDNEAARKAYVDAAKQFWVPVTVGTTMGNLTDFPVCELRLSGDDAYMSFYTPDDFHQIVEAYVVVVAQCTVATPSWAAYSHYGKAGEAYNTHTDSAWARPASCTANNIYECAIIPVLDVLEAGDYVGISFTLWDDEHDVDVVGIMFKYT